MLFWISVVVIPVWFATLVAMSIVLRIYGNPKLKGACRKFLIAKWLVFICGVVFLASIGTRFESIGLSIGLAGFSLSLPFMKSAVGEVRNNSTSKSDK